MDDPSSWEIASRGPAGVTGRQTAGEPRNAVLQYCRSTRSMDRSIHTASTAHLTVGRIDDGIHVLLGDVTLHHDDVHRSFLPEDSKADPQSPRQVCLDFYSPE